MSLSEFATALSLLPKGTSLHFEPLPSSIFSIAYGSGTAPSARSLMCSESFFGLKENASIVFFDVQTALQSDDSGDLPQITLNLPPPVVFELVVTIVYPVGDGATNGHQEILRLSVNPGLKGKERKEAFRREFAYTLNSIEERLIASLPDPTNAAFVLVFATEEQAKEYASLLPDNFTGVSVEGKKVTVPRKLTDDVILFTLVWMIICLSAGGAVYLSLQLAELVHATQNLPRVHGGLPHGSRASTSPPASGSESDSEDD